MGATKTLLDKSLASMLINDFFDRFENCCNSTTSPTVADLSKVLSPDFHIVSNEHHIARNLQEYVDNIKNLQKEYSNFKVIRSSEDLIISKNKVVVQYALHITPRLNGQTNQILMMAVGTIDNDKFSSWKEVSHHKGQSQWNK